MRGISEGTPGRRVLRSMCSLLVASLMRGGRAANCWICSLGSSLMHASSCNQITSGALGTSDHLRLVRLLQMIRVVGQTASLLGR